MNLQCCFKFRTIKSSYAAMSRKRYFPQLGSKISKMRDLMNTTASVVVLPSRLEYRTWCYGYVPLRITPENRTSQSSTIRSRVLIITRVPSSSPLMDSAASKYPADVVLIVATSGECRCYYRREESLHGNSTESEQRHEKQAAPCKMKRMNAPAQSDGRVDTSLEPSIANLS